MPPPCCPPAEEQGWSQPRSCGSSSPKTFDKQVSFLRLSFFLCCSFPLPLSSFCSLFGSNLEVSMEVLQQCYHSISALSLNSLFDSSFNCRTYTFPPAYSFTLELLHWLCRIESRADAWLSWSATNIEVSSWLARTSELLWGALVHFGQ